MTYTTPTIVDRGDVAARTLGVGSRSIESSTQKIDNTLSFDQDKVVNGVTMTLDPANGKYDLTETLGES